MNSKIREILLIVFGAVFLATVGVLAGMYTEQRREAAMAAEVAALLVEDPTPTPAETSPAEPSAPAETPTPTKRPVPHTAQHDPSQDQQSLILEKFTKLTEANPDTIGWLRIENTKIDNVVMWTPAEPDKYLHLDFFGKPSDWGTLYLDGQCNIDTSDNLIIYGHHMRDGTMFGNLIYYADKNYWSSHRYLTFDTIYEERTYEVAAAFYGRVLRVEEEGFRYYKYRDAETEEDFNEFKSFIEEHQCYDTGIEIEYGEQLLTLSTCAYQTENGRFAIVCRRVTGQETTE